MNTTDQSGPGPDATADALALLPDTAGMGLRRDLLPEMQETDLSDVDFFEVAPENWIGMGGRFARDLRSFTERFNCIAHGLSLSVGSVDALDFELLSDIRGFMREHGIERYTEHLSWCSFEGQLYDLLPVPNTEEAVRWVANRIRQVQDFLGMRIGVENASYYVQPQGAQMEEATFIRAVAEEADCLLHLDVNNVYVNSRNFGFDAQQYLQRLPLERVCYMHVAGHYVAPDGFIVDTHGADVAEPVWDLLQTACAGILHHQTALPPTCLERDFNFPKLEDLIREVNHIRYCQQQAVQNQHRAGALTAQIETEA